MDEMNREWVLTGNSLPEGIKLTPLEKWIRDEIAIRGSASGNEILEAYKKYYPYHSISNIQN